MMTMTVVVVVVMMTVAGSRLACTGRPAAWRDTASTAVFLSGTTFRRVTSEHGGAALGTGAGSKVRFGHGRSRGRQRLSQLRGGGRVVVVLVEVMAMAMTMTMATTRRPTKDRRRLRFGRPPPPLVNVIEHDPRQQVTDILQLGTFERKRPELLGQPVPAKKGAKVYVDDLQGRQVLEGMQGNRSIKGKLLVSADEPGTVVWRESEAGNLGEGRVEVFEVCFQGSLGLFRLGDGVPGGERCEAKGGPEGAHGGHDAADAGDGVNGVPVSSTAAWSAATGPLRFAEKGDVCGGGLIVDVLEADVERSHGHGELLEAGEQVEEVVGGQGQSGRPHRVRGESECPQGERSSECRGRRRASWDSKALLMGVLAVVVVVIVAVVVVVVVVGGGGRDVVAV